MLFLGWAFRGSRSCYLVNRSPGNRNTGHLFETPATPAERHPGTIGPYLTPEERMALIEYLKTL